MSARVLICCGSGGVGKTTTSAALALRLALDGHRVAVLTIDPARRLADSLGIGPLGNDPQRVPIEQLDPACTGHLDAMMLDTKATFDTVVSRFAPTDASRRRILENRYYRFASTRLAGSHEYMAMERLYELYEQGGYDALVLDTPPTRHAIEFLRAPDRMSNLMDEGVMHWLSLPRDSVGFHALEKGSDLVAGILSRMVGGKTIGEIAEFFYAFRDLYTGFRERSQQVKRLLSGSNSAFLLVTTPAPAARREAGLFLDVLREARMPFGGFIVNRVTPSPSSAAPLPPSALPPRPAGISPALWAEITAGVCQARPHQAQLAAAERSALAELSREAGDAPVWPIPEMAIDVHALPNLAALALELRTTVNALMPRSGTD